MLAAAATALLAGRAAAQNVTVPDIAEFTAIVDRVSADSVLATLRHLESLGVKAPGTPALAATADWLQARYEALGYTDVRRQDYQWRGRTLQNVIATREGTVAPDKLVVVTGHYDTIGGPGVNDNGSGTAVMLEAARVLRSIPTNLTVVFIHFSGEEVGLIGSRAYVSEIAVPRNLDIQLVLNVDQVGGVAGAANTTVTVERDEGPPGTNDRASAAVTDTLAALTRGYSALETRIDRAWGSDYLPFEDAGYVITGFYEANESRAPHTPDDVLANMDPQYVTEIARATVAGVLHFARAAARSR